MARRQRSSRSTAKPCTDRKQRPMGPAHSIYVLALKDNQASLWEDVRFFFADTELTAGLE